jgi:hypothetical protein
MLATISGAGPMTGFLGQWWDDSGFHKWLLLVDK